MMAKTDNFKMVPLDKSAAVLTEQPQNAAPGQPGQPGQPNAGPNGGAPMPGMENMPGMEHPHR